MPIQCTFILNDKQTSLLLALALGSFPRFPAGALAATIRRQSTKRTLPHPEGNLLHHRSSIWWSARRAP